MAITVTGQTGPFARCRVVTVPELVHDDVRIPSHRQVATAVLNLVMMWRAKLAFKGLVLVSRNLRLSIIKISTQISV